MKSSVTDVTDPAKLSKLAGSTMAKPPVCELTSLSFACLHPGWIFPLVLEQTHSKGPRKDVGGQVSVAGGVGITKPPWSSPPSMKLLVPTSGSPQSCSAQRPRSCSYLGTHVIHSSLGCLGPALQSHHSACLTIRRPGDLFFPAWLREKCRLNSALRFCLDISCSLLN